MVNREDEAAKAQGGSAPAASAEAAPATIVLASASPRRRELLARAGVPFLVRVADADESLADDLAASPHEAACAVADRKAGTVVQELLASGATGMYFVIGADTMVVCAGEIFGKPRNLEDATRMLGALSGVTHEVVTGVACWAVALAPDGTANVGHRTFWDASQVTFKPLTSQQIADYLRCGESFDKAGAYAAQGEGAKLIDRIDGATDTVIGLPVGRLIEEFPDVFAPYVAG